MVAPARCILLLFLVFLGACSAPAPRRAADAAQDPVILISIDGFRADYLDRGFTPTLSALAADGVRAEALKPSFPTLTFPNHYTIVTGLYPDHHGIVNNRMVDPKTGKVFVYKEQATIADPAWWGGEPLWVGVERSGRHAATMFWPGSDVAIDGVRPSHWQAFDGKLAPDARVDQLLRWSDLAAADKPVFLTLYFEQVDHEGHDNGPDSPEVDAAMREIDHALAHLVDGLKQRGVFDRTNIVIVSDHGMTATSHERLIYLDDLFDIADVEVVTSGILAGLNPKPEYAQAISSLLLAPHDHMQCWNKSDVPARLHYGSNPRVPALLCLADDGWIITSHDYEAKRTHFSLGEHGYDNDDPAMRALFVAHGPSFKKGLVVPEFENVDIYPLMTHLLGIKEQPNDGDFNAVESMLTSTP